MSTPARQRSLRERIQSASRGIGISWQGKKSRSYHCKESLAEAQASSNESQNQSTQPQDEPDGRPTDIPLPDTTFKNEGGAAPEEKKPLGRTLTQPQNTVEYKVSSSDTLAGIAARFDITPSELAKLNRLGTRMVFPGQVLFVPEKKNKGTEETDDQQEPSDTLHLPQDLQERRPSVTDALRIPYRRMSERAHRFLKVKARHFTDGQGVVSGVLIITPNAVMFDPNVSDPLVLEQGVEAYGVIAPLDMLMRAAIYFDIAHMKVQANPMQQPRPKADIFFGKMTEEGQEAQEDLPPKAPSIEVAPVATPPSTPIRTEPPEPLPSSQSQKHEHTPEPMDQSKQQETALTQDESATAANLAESVDSCDDEVNDAFSEQQESGPGGVSQESRRERMLKRLSYPMESITSISRMITSSPKHLVEFSGSLFSSSGSRGSTDEDKDQPEEQHPSNLTLENQVEEKPEIFEALDKLLSQRRPCDDEGPPLYLCLRMGLPKIRKPHPSPVLSYGKKRARSEYWFSIPRSRVEDLYNFLQQWIPQLYGDVDDVDLEEAGFLPIDDNAPDEEDDEEEEELEGGEQDGESGDKAPRSFLKLVEDTFGFKSISPGDWEVLSLGEMEKVDYTNMELPLPDLLLPSEILQEEHIKELCNLLPARAVGYPWTRIFSTSHDGFHLKSLYRKMSDFDSPVILAIQDTQGAVFGALLSYPLKLSDSFYGTGESFLFTFHTSFKVFKWSGDNDYFVKGSYDSVSIGASEGHFGLWLDSDLYRGSSVHCQTYDNDPLASSNDFIIKTLEAWGFA